MKDPNRTLKLNATIIVEFHPDIFANEAQRSEAVSKIREKVIQYLNQKCGSTILSKEYVNAELVKIL